jgi:hypothetical protein
VKSGSGASAWKSSQTEETDNDGSHTHNLSETGGDQPHNIVQPSIVFNVEMKFARGTDGDLTNHAPALGGSQASAAPSCQIIKTAASDSEDGVYWLDVTGGDTSDAFQAYCDMTSEGGGWTMIAAQFEQDPVLDWNEGIQPDYDPTLATSKGFALDTDRLPAHSEIAFGQQFTATYVDYADFVYSTGNIDLQTIVGKKAADEYHVFRSDTHFYHACNADMSLNTDTSGIYVDQLGIEKVGGGGNLDWCFTPAHNLPHWRGRTMLGVQLHQTNETYAWTLWVR